jgi:hypothetical protein
VVGFWEQLGEPFSSLGPGLTYRRDALSAHEPVDTYQEK